MTYRSNELTFFVLVSRFDDTPGGQEKGMKRVRTGVSIGFSDWSIVLTYHDVSPPTPKSAALANTGTIQVLSSAPRADLWVGESWSSKSWANFDVKAFPSSLATKSWASVGKTESKGQGVGRFGKVRKQIWEDKTVDASVRKVQLTFLVALGSFAGVENPESRDIYIKSRGQNRVSTFPRKRGFKVGSHQALRAVVTAAAPPQILAPVLLKGSLAEMEPKS